MTVKQSQPLKVEIWAVVSGFDAFEVSSLGRLRRTRSCKGTPIAEKRPTMGKDGYFRTSLVQQGRRRDVTLHRLVCETFHGQQPEGKPCVAHIDGDKGNNSADNLRWSSYAENERDKISHGKTPRGERNAMARLNADIVREIRNADYSVRGSARKMAKKIGVAPSVICLIRKGRAWKHAS